MADGPVDDLRNKIARREVLAIVGCGVSIGATGGEPQSNGWPLVSWPGLLHHGVEFCAANATTPLPPDWADTVRRQIGWGNLDGLLLAAEAISRVLDAPKGGDFRRWLRAACEPLRAAHTEVIQAIAAPGIPIATTNYDGLIEAVTGQPAVTWRQDNEVERVLRGEKRAVLHLHGHWEDSASVVLGIRSYGEIVDDAHVQAMLHASRAFKTLLFIGVGDGLSDPNFGALRDWARAAFAGSETLHYRLARDAEVAELQKQHPPAERIRVLGFGPDHRDLADFLRRLVPSPAPATPAPCSSLVATLPPRPACYGRDAPVKDLVGTLLKKHPLPTPILGGPGIGKTTVTLAALHDPKVARRFGARRFFVRCDAARTRAEVVAAIGNPLGVPVVPEREPLVVAELAHAPAVLVLDNLETPWEADRAPTEDLLGLLSTIPGLALVASIRGGERPAGTSWREEIRIERLAPAAARTAFLDVAGAAKFGADPRLEDLLRAVDHVPLAVVLLAHYAQPEPNLTAVWNQWLARKTAILKRLDGDGRLLSIAFSVEVSIQGRRMDAGAWRLLRLLGVLPDGIAWSDLDAVLPPSGGAAARTLRAVGLAYDEAERLRVLAPIRDYVRDHHPPTPAELNPAIYHYVTLASNEGRKVGWVGGDVACRRLAVEVANLDTMIHTGLDLPDPRQAIGAAQGLVVFFRASGLGTPRILERARDVAIAVSDDSAAAGCSYWLGLLAFQRSDHDVARSRYEEALLLFVRAGDIVGQANCIWSLGDIALERSDHEAARARYEEALPLYVRVGAVLGQANCIKGLGDIALERSDHEAAREKFEESLALYSRIEEPYSIGWAHRRLARIAPDPEALRRHVVAAREAWTRIDRADLVAELRGEFGDLESADRPEGPPGS